MFGSVKGAQPVTAGAAAIGYGGPVVGTVVNAKTSVGSDVESKVADPVDGTDAEAPEK